MVISMPPCFVHAQQVPEDRLQLPDAVRLKVHEALKDLTGEAPRPQETHALQGHHRCGHLQVSVLYAVWCSTPTCRNREAAV